MSVKHWIQAARLRTLPLAISTMVMGHSLAASEGFFTWSIALWSILTAITLQVLSNFANDYGDSIHGADHRERTGPKRAVQTGSISARQMKLAIYVLAIASFVFGVILLFDAFGSWPLRVVFLIIGVSAIWAAINYTAGLNPYGYSGKGDISVFIFFGLVTVIGSYFLQTKFVKWDIVFPAITCGALSMGVLNINNIRDIDSDQQAGKRSIPVKIGRSAAITYHAILLSISILSLVIFGFVAAFGLSLKWLFLISIPLFLINYKGVSKYTEASKLDPYLKQLALSTTALILIFCLGLIYG